MNYLLSNNKNLPQKKEQTRQKSKLRKQQSYLNKV